MKVKIAYQGWYHHSRDTLATILELQNDVLHMIGSSKDHPSATMMSKLRRLQQKVDKAIDIEKCMFTPSGENHPQHDIPIQFGSGEHQIVKCGLEEPPFFSPVHKHETTFGIPGGK